MSAALRYFKLNDDVGEHPDDPFQAMSLQIETPTMVGSEVVDLTETHVLTPRPELDAGYSARIIPGTRVVEARDSRVQDFLAGDSRFHETDNPDAAARRKTTTKER